MLEFGTYDIASRRPWSYFLAGRRCRKICSTNAISKSSKPPKPLIDRNARVAKLADAPDLGSGGAIHRGSSPLPSTPRLENLPPARCSHPKRPKKSAFARVKDFSPESENFSPRNLNFFLVTKSTGSYSAAAGGNKNRQHVNKL